MDTCRRGHPWTVSNTRWIRHSASGIDYRYCRRCQAERERIYRGKSEVKRSPVIRPSVRHIRKRRTHGYTHVDYPL